MKLTNNGIMLGIALLAAARGALLPLAQSKFSKVYDRLTILCFRRWQVESRGLDIIVFLNCTRKSRSHFFRRLDFSLDTALNTWIYDAKCLIL